MKKTLLLDENGVDISVKTPAALELKLTALTDKLAPGRVMSLLAALKAVGGSDSQVRKILSGTSMSQRMLIIHRRLYVCSPATFKIHHDNT